MLEGCVICRGAEADRELSRTEVWGDALWRLSTSVAGAPVAGLSYLEPRRHATALDGPEAATFSGALNHCSTVLKDVTGAELVYVHVLGDGSGHLRVCLAPHSPGDDRDGVLLTGRCEPDRSHPALPDAILRITAAQLRGAFLHAPGRLAASARP